MEAVWVLLLALLIDVVAGDPPDSLHPVAWMGKAIALMEKLVKPVRPALQFVHGVVIIIVLLALFTVPVYFLLLFLKGYSVWVYTVIAAVLLKITFSIMGLRKAALTIKRLILNRDSAGARYGLRALVSRDTASLSEPLAVSAVVESVAEGTCDSVIAPLFYFLLLGVPGAIAYRLVNTADAMLGYHGKYEYLGKFAARLDDVLNYIPARIAALLLVLAAAFRRCNWRLAWSTALREHGKTESPNAGWTMAAMAGALGVRLEKRGHYALGKKTAPLVPGVIDKAAGQLLAASAVWSVLCLITLGVMEYAAQA